MRHRFSVLSRSFLLVGAGACVTGLIACGSHVQELGGNDSGEAPSNGDPTSATPGASSGTPGAESPGTTAPPNTNAGKDAGPDSDAGAQADTDAGSSADADAGQATDAGPLDPFAFDPTRPTLTGTELKAYVDGKDVNVDGSRIGTFEIFSRERNCGSPCGAWTTTTTDVLVPMSSRNNPRPTPRTGEIYVYSGLLQFIAQVPGATSPTAGTGYFRLTCESSLPQDGLALERDCRANPGFLFTGAHAFTPKNLMQVPYSGTSFYFPGETYLGEQAAVSGTSLIQFAGRVYRDGTVHLITTAGGANTGNGLHQLSIVGHLDGI